MTKHGLWLSGVLLFSVSPLIAHTDFELMVEERGLKNNVIDLSGSNDVKIEEPQLAFVNFLDIATIPPSKHVTLKGYMEMYDGQGHYFKKPVTMAGQGGYSIRFPKRNFVCHFTDHEWNEDNGPDLEIGEWVKQDAFHFKAFYTDFTRGIGEMGYKLFYEMVADRRPYWERGGYKKASKARCFPDGFPCVVFLNGNFHGIYAWQLKKHRKNMNQKKELAEHIHLDGNLQDTYFFRGSISWSQFEVRTPKGLYTKYGTLYDGNSPTELIDEHCEAFNRDTDSAPVVQAKQLTAEVKKHLVDISHYWTELKSYEDNHASPEEMRREIEERYDVEGMIDYAVFHYFSQNGDGTLKNWQWFTYDGHRLTVTPYDLDQTFGIGLYGNLLPHYLPLEPLTSGPFYWLHRYYQEDIRDRYAEMRQKQILDYDNIAAIISDWYERIGDDLYAMEQQRWQNSPCYKDAVCNNGWEACELSDSTDYLSEDAVRYDKKREYRPGEVCWLESRLWRATKTVKGVTPFVVNANRDSMERLLGWLEGRLAFLDALFAYSPAAEDVPGLTLTAEKKHLVAIYTLSGMEVQTPVIGQAYIFKYSDGTSRKAFAR